MENKNPRLQEGFIRESRPQGLNLTGQQKAALLRKGNELFNQGKIEESRKIFVTLGYTDGMIRVGKYYYSKKRFAEALKMFASAPDLASIKAMAPTMAKILRVWLESDSAPVGRERV